jgi:hypothetical protein
MNRSITRSVPLALTLLAGLAPFASLAHAQCPTDPVWVQVFPENSPSPRYSPASTQGGKDANGNLTAVYYGGLNAGGIQPDLWQWTGSDWVLRVANAGPLSRSNAAARPINDIAPAGSIMIHGGVDPGTNVRNEILLWQDNQSSNTVSFLRNGPGARFNHAWAANPNTPDNLMTGGGTCAGLNNEAWWVSSTLTISISNPSFDSTDNQRWLHSIIFDSNRNRFWSLGGSTTTCAALSADGRSFGRVGGSFNGTWTNFLSGVSPNRASAGAAYNPVRDQLIVFGGDTQPFPSSQGLRGDTWLTPDGGITWRQIPGPAPSARRAFNALQYVPAKNHFVLFGGHDGNYLGDTWVLTYGPTFTRQPRDLVSCPSNPIVGTQLEAGGPTPFYRFEFLNPSTQQWQLLQAGAFILNGEFLGLVTLSQNLSSFTFNPVVSGPRVIGQFRGRLFSQVFGCSSEVSEPFTITIADVCCDSIDFNNDGASFDPQDIDAFLSVFSEGPCIPASATCSDIDFNNDGAVFDPCDINAFLTVFSEGPCSNCGD